MHVSSVFVDIRSSNVEERQEDSGHDQGGDVLRRLPVLVGRRVDRELRVEDGDEPRVPDAAQDAVLEQVPRGSLEAIALRDPGLLGVDHDPRLGRQPVGVDDHGVELPALHVGERGVGVGRAHERRPDESVVDRARGIDDRDLLRLAEPPLLALLRRLRRERRDAAEHDDQEREEEGREPERPLRDDAHVLAARDGEVPMRHGRPSPCGS
jgi:hypothetical protein